MLKMAFFCLIEDLLRGLSGPIGILLRRAYYRRRLRSCGTHLIIDSGVHILGAEHISVGDWVWIDKNCIIAAGPLKHRDEVKRIATNNPPIKPGEIRLGSSCHLGIGTIIQAHGGVSIGDAFCSSAGVKIYSMSNDPHVGRGGPIPRADNHVARVETPVCIGDNVWLGLNVSVIGGCIGSHSFVKPLSVVLGNIPGNKVVVGFPAMPQKPRYFGGDEQASGDFHWASPPC